METNTGDAPAANQRRTIVNYQQRCFSDWSKYTPTPTRPDSKSPVFLRFGLPTQDLRTTHANTFISIGQCMSLASMVSKGGWRQLNNDNILTEGEFRRFVHSCVPYPNRPNRNIRQTETPELVVIWGFCDFIDKIKVWCKQNNILLTHGELGWFPHYESFHLDPEGFCWESMLAKQTYLSNINNTAWSTDVADVLFNKNAKYPPVPEHLKHTKFALWVCQLVSDKVNTKGKNFLDWGGVIRHFRSILPDDIKLVVRLHPKMNTRIQEERYTKDRIQRALSMYKNVFFEHEGVVESYLDSVNCVCVAGANSTVLYEAALKFNKPAYAYADSWYSCKGEHNLVTMIDFAQTEKLEIPERSKADVQAQLWFTGELIQRQQLRKPSYRHEFSNIRKWVLDHSAVPDNAIQRQVHFIWIGNNKMPLMYLKCLDEFKQLNKGLQVTLWQDIPDDAPEEVKQKYHSLEHYNHKSDLLRAYLLWRYGGIYLDADTVWIRSLPEALFLNGRFCSSNFRTPMEGGYMGCSAGDVSMKMYLDTLLKLPVKDIAFHDYGPTALRALQTLMPEGFKTFGILPWWYFNVACCDKEKYLPLLRIPLLARMDVQWPEMEAESDFDLQYPIGQHLHGSVNGQYQ